MAMVKDYKKFILIIGVALFLFFLTVSQISFINLSFLNLNLFLILILCLVLSKYNSKALVFAWLGGILTGTVYFSNFEINALVLLILTAILIIIYKTAFLTLRTESVLFMSIIGVALYHFLSWFIINVLALVKTGVFEKFAFSFSGREILTEMALTAAVMLIIFKFKIKTPQAIRQRWGRQNA